MGCCGQSRAAYGGHDEARYPQAQPAPAPMPWTAEPAAAAPPAGGVRLHFTRQARVRVRGPVSGTDYVFSGSDPVQSVAAVDADGLLRTGYFRRAY